VSFSLRAASSWRQERAQAVADGKSTVGESLSGLFGMIPAMAAATSFMVLVLAFIHEWAFYFVIGGQYQSLVSVTDYFNSAIGWLPWAVLGILTALLLELMDPARNIPLEDMDDYHRTHRLRWLFERAPLLFLFFAFTVTGAVEFFSEIGMSAVL
jgi:hypothetical protein